MKLVSYRSGTKEKLGLFYSGTIYNLSTNAQLAGSTLLPETMSEFLLLGDEGMIAARQVEQLIRLNDQRMQPDNVNEKDLLAPVPHPTSCRDGYAFRQHVEAARRNRKVPMIPEFDQYPIFYFTNHNAIQGPGEIFCMPDHFQTFMHLRRTNILPVI
jgi:fumarylacetoacetate (FAA) hydrolase